MQAWTALSIRGPLDPLLRLVDLVQDMLQGEHGRLLLDRQGDGVRGPRVDDLRPPVGEPEVQGREEGVIAQVGDDNLFQADIQGVQDGAHQVVGHRAGRR